MSASSCRNRSRGFVISAISVLSSLFSSECRPGTRGLRRGNGRTAELRSSEGAVEGDDQQDDRDHTGDRQDDQVDGQRNAQPSLGPKIRGGLTLDAAVRSALTAVDG